MLAAVIKNGKLRLRQKPVPRLRRGWALVRVRLAGICNTDLELLRGYHDFHGTPGHEFVGEVVRIGGGKDSRWLGRRVVGEINIGCASRGRKRLCAYCRRGIPSHCFERRVLGIVAHDGAFAEYLTLPLGNLHVVPDRVTDEQAVFTEPLAAACEILEQVPAAGLHTAAVLGDGKLAQLVARVLGSAGPGVTMLGKHDRKLAVARAAGIKTATVGASWGKVVSRYGQKFPLVVEATGSPLGLQQAVQLVAPRGTLVVKSTFHGAARLETWPIVVHEIKLVGSRCGPFPRALELLRRHRVDPRPLIGHVFPLREAAAAIRCARWPGVLKVLLKP